MEIKIINNLEEMQKYYDEKSNTYIFKEGDDFIDLVIFNFDLDISANIKAWDIKAKKIKAADIESWDIDARDIDAINIKSRDIKARNINADIIDVRDITAEDIYTKCFNAKDIRANDIESLDIVAHDIQAHIIDAIEIEACDIKAFDIIATDINYFAVCFAYNNIKCESITGKKQNAKHFVIDGMIETSERE